MNHAAGLLKTAEKGKIENFLLRFCRVLCIIIKTFLRFGSSGGFYADGSDYYWDDYYYSNSGPESE